MKSFSVVWEKNGLVRRAKGGAIGSRETHLPLGVIQRMVNYSHLGHQSLRHGRFAVVVLVVRGKLQLVDAVTEIVSDTLFLQVWDQFVNVLVVRRLEGATRGEMDVAGDLVNTETTGDIAALVSLFPQFVCPTFFYTLPYPIKLGGLRECLGEVYRPEKLPRGN